jgi:O-antigen/teichoic acid export membrane protein
MTGTTIAQAIPIAISPILTRIYTPEDFGVFALYISVASIIAVIATGRYELAIMLPKKDEDAMNIVVLSIVISFFVSLITLLIVFIFNSQITNLLENPEISSWLYFIPLTVLLTGMYQSFNYWNNRKKQYKKLATNKVVQSGITATTNLGMGLSGFGSSGLIFGKIFGQGVATAALGKMIWTEDKSFLQNVKVLKIMALVKRYIQFPKFDILASLFNVSSHYTTHILFNILFDTTTAGYYYLTQRVIGLPTAFIASAISDVFRQKASKDYKKYGNCINIYKRTFNKLFILSLFPSLFLYVFVIDGFVIIFGQEWVSAGEYVQTLIPMFFIKFIASPLSFMLYIGEKQQLNFYSQILFIVSIVFSFLLGSNAQEVVQNIAISFSLIYLYYLYISAKIAKVF